jgi:hypothetical protein
MDAATTTRSGIRVLEEDMGASRQKRLMLKKKEEELRKAGQRLLSAEEATRRIEAEIAPMMTELDDLTGELQVQIDEICNRMGPEIFPKDDAIIARFLLDNKVFDPDTLDRSVVNRPELTFRLASRLVRFLREPKNASALEEIEEVMKTVIEENQDKNWKDVTAYVAGIVFARRILSEKPRSHPDFDPNLYIPFQEIDWSKHMSRDEIVHHAKVGIGAFLRAHEDGLTGRALSAKRAVDSLPPQGRKEINASLEFDQDGDFKALKEYVEPIFSSEYPVIEPEKRAEAFTSLFEMVANWMQEGWMRSGRAHDLDVDAVAYLAAENIFLKGYDRSKLDDGAASDVIDKLSIEQFEKRLLAMQASLTGAALEAKGAYWRLPELEKKSLQRVVDHMPSKMIKGFGQTIEEFIKNRSGQSWMETIDFQLVFDAVNSSVNDAGINGEFDAVDVGIHLRSAFAYLVTEKLLRDGFKESLRTRKESEKKKDENYMPVTELWSDKELTSTGMALWKQTYGAGGGDSDVVKRAREVAQNWGRDVSERGILVNEQRLNVVEAIMGFTAKWAVHAFQRITTTHTYAAALMCSDADRSVLEDIEMQWHAFMICVPNGLLSYTDEERKTDTEYNRILVASFDHQAIIVLLNQGSEKSSNRLVAQVSSTIADLLDVGDSEIVHTLGEDTISSSTKSKVQRIIILAKRLVAGLLLALQNQNNFKSKTSPSRDGKKHRDPGSEPAHRVVFVGAALKIDCRPNVADYIRNGSPRRKGAPPQVQTLVRGHHKRQVCGVGRAGRKVIFVEPFWRGDVDAPILTRPKKVSG